MCASRARRGTEARAVWVRMSRATLPAQRFLAITRQG
jgi:hypothetical protein